MSGIAERLAEVLRDHGIYGFNGSQVACRCSPRNWRAVLDWHAHVAEIQAELMEREIAAARGEVVARVGAIADEYDGLILAAVNDGEDVVNVKVRADRLVHRLRAALSPDPDRGEGEGK